MLEVEGMWSKTAIRYQVFVQVFITWVLTANAAMASVPVSIVPEKQNYSLEQSLEVLIDDANHLTFEQIRNEPPNSFIPLQAFNVSAPIANANYWFRLTLENETLQPQLLTLSVEPMLSEEIKVFLPDGRQGWQTLISGFKHPANKHSQGRLDPAFDIVVPAQKQLTLYLKVHPLLIFKPQIRLWEPKSFNIQKGYQFLFRAACYGLMISMVIYNLFIFLSIRNIAYLYYSIYLFSFINMNMLFAGFTSTYFWPEVSMPWILEVIYLLHLVTFFWTILFARSLLETATNMPSWDRLLKVFAVILIGLIPFIFILDIFIVNLLIQLVDLISVLTLIITGVIAWLLRISVARYFLIAWVCFFVGVIINAIAYLGVLEINLFTDNVAIFGTVTEAMLLSLALAYRINTLRQEALSAEQIATSEAQARQEIAEENLKLVQDNARMNAEMDVTRRLQEMILPTQDELKEIEALDIAAYMKPADEVGGDYYDVLSYEDKIIICIGDVTGHGLASGITMLMAQTAVRLQAIHEIYGPQPFFSGLNKVLYDNLKRMGIDKNMTFLMMDYSEGKIRLSGQHENVIVVRKNGEIEQIDTFELGFMLAIVPDISEFVEYIEIQLEPEDCLILYTDGITEAFNTEREQYGIERLCEVVQSHRQAGADTIKQAVIDSVYSYAGDQRPVDVITLLVLKQKSLGLS